MVNRNQFREAAGAALGRVGGRGKGGQRERQEEGGFFWSFQSDFTNEMGKCHETDRVGSNGHPVRAS